MVVLVLDQVTRRDIATPTTVLLIANGPDGVAGVAVQKAVAVEANLDRDLN